DVRSGIEAVAEAQRPGEFHDPFGECVRNVIEHVEALGAGAHLPGIEVRGPAGRARGDVEIRITADDERIVAAKLEMRLLDLRGTELADALARLHRSGEGDEIRSGMHDERLSDLLAESGHDIHHAR